MPNSGQCAGEEFAAFAGIGILSSYLLLFISFYFATYKKPAKRGHSRSISALIEMKDEKIPTVSETRRRFSGDSVPRLMDFKGSVSSGASTPASNTRVTRSRKA